MSGVPPGSTGHMMVRGQLHVCGCQADAECPLDEQQCSQQLVQQTAKLKRQARWAA